VEDELRNDALTVIREVRRLRLTLAASLNQRLGDSGVTLAQFAAMGILDQTGESTMSALAGKMGTTLGAATNLADRLIAAGYATRSRSETDRRVVNVALTPQGHEFVQRLHAWGSESIMRLFREIPAQDRRTFLDVFHRLADVIEADASRPSDTPDDPPRC